MASSGVQTPIWVAQLQTPPPGKAKIPGFQDPLGFSLIPPSSGSKKSKEKDPKALQPRKPPTADEMDTLKMKKAWEVALAPVKGLPMTAIMMYMSGNSLQIFSIMMVFMAFKNPISALMSVNQAFERFQSETNSARILQTKLIFVACNILALGLGVWKVNGMGLLPTTRSDWLMWESMREPTEHVITAL